MTKVTLAARWGMAGRHAKPEDLWRQFQWPRGEWLGLLRCHRDGEMGKHQRHVLSTWFHGTHGLDMGGEKGGGAWHGSPKERKIADPSPVCSP